MKKVYFFHEDDQKSTAKSSKVTWESGGLGIGDEGDEEDK
ncbi:hypothetical protein FDUTEX481_04868 [Tolypothrix sp. PCC 7601]|nr:hypothetical protein FDUTEX481_04868 [Tolypothrix sp. PCC 7601]